MDVTMGTRNVAVVDTQGNVLSSLWQYGSVSWDTFYEWIEAITVTAQSWELREWNNDTLTPGDKIFPRSPLPVEAGTYVIMSKDSRPLSIDLTSTNARPRHPSRCQSSEGQGIIGSRARDRDMACLASGLGLTTGNLARFRATHIFPRAHHSEWMDHGFDKLILDDASTTEMGGPSKIDSIQNLILLRGDLHDAWDECSFGVDPDRGYLIIPFIEGFDDIAGRYLQLDHIDNPNHRPLDALFRDHLLQCVYKNMKGMGDDNEWDYDDAIGGGYFDLSDDSIWGGLAGKEHLEFELAERLFSIKVSQDISVEKSKVSI